jgi:phosphoribosyl 1,2-cyclic phosphodiesterase
MKITFLGTRGYIESKSKLHKMHTSTLISHMNKNVMIDCGQDWLKKVWKINPDAIVITHSHPDHCWGLKEGSPCPVYAIKESWQVMKNFKIDKKHQKLIKLRKVIDICGIKFETFPVVHSLLAPAVGYRICHSTSLKLRRTSFFIVPDVVYIEDRHDAFKNIKFYIGDGATIIRSMVRKKGDKLFGHTPVQTQLTWCKKEKVPMMIVTHCGTEITSGDPKKINAKIKKLAQQRGVKVKIAHDGMVVRI